MKLNAKELLIKEQVDKGLSFEEIAKMDLCKEGYLKRTISRLGYDWETMQPKIEIGLDPGSPEGDSTGIVEIRNAVQPLDIDQQMDQMNDQANARLMAQAMALVMQDPAAFLQLMGDKEVTPKGIVKKVEKCSRHPDIDVKPGDNCPRCLEESHAHEALMNNRDYVVPCPKCGNSLRQMYGGTIKKMNSPGIYACGSCEVTYSAKGEMTTWDSGLDKKYFDKAQKAGLF